MKNSMFRPRFMWAASGGDIHYRCKLTQFLNEARSETSTVNSASRVTYLLNKARGEIITVRTIFFFCFERTGENILNSKGAPEMS